MKGIILSATMLASAIMIADTPAIAAKRIHCIKEPVNTLEWFGSCAEGHFSPRGERQEARRDPHSGDKPNDSPDDPPVVESPPGWPPIIDIPPPPEEPPAIAKPSRKGKADRNAGRKGRSFKGIGPGSSRR